MKEKIYNYNVEIIKNYIAKNRLTKAEFCKRCKISCKTLNKILSRKCNIQLRVICSILEEVKCSAFDFLGA